MLKEGIQMDETELIKKICAYVKANQERPYAIEGYERAKIEKYWYSLHAHNILSVHNYSGSKTADSSGRGMAIITKIEVNEALLEALHGIRLD